MVKGAEEVSTGEAMAGNVATAVNMVVAMVVVAATDTPDQQHQPLSIVVYTIIAIEMKVYVTLNLCKIVFLIGLFIFAFFTLQSIFSLNTGIGFFFSLKTS